MHRLCAYRGVTELGALTRAAEVCDWHRFPAARTHPAAGATLRRRQEGLDPAVAALAWRSAAVRPFHRLDQRKPSRKTVVTAIARELASFVWSEMTAA